MTTPGRFLTWAAPMTTPGRFRRSTVRGEVVNGVSVPDDVFLIPPGLDWKTVRCSVDLVHLNGERPHRAPQTPAVEHHSTVAEQRTQLTGV